jgi:DNA replication and repair protein RecF
MELKYLRVHHFRNLASVSLDLDPRFNLFSGRNGQGKTNLLEAVYLLSALKSFRTARNQELLAWDQPEAVVEALVDRAGHERRARVEINAQSKRVLLNDLPIRQLSRFFGSLNAVVFSPDDIRLLKGSPDGRRQFLDRAIFNCEAGYLADVMAYEGVLKQRNALLKDASSNKTLLEVYDEQLASAGAVLLRRRALWLRDYAPFFVRAFAAIFLGDDREDPLQAELAYETAWLGPLSAPLLERAPEEAFCQDALLVALRASRGEDLRRKFTTRGPHRDDLGFRLAGHEARAFASQGQQRSLVLALKVAEVQLFEARRGFRPILLLDDVSSELDRVRNRFLFDFLCQSAGQVFLTTTHRDHILLDQQLTAFHVENGEVQPLPRPM